MQLSYIITISAKRNQGTFKFPLGSHVEGTSNSPTQLLPGAKMIVEVNSRARNVGGRVALSFSFPFLMGESPSTGKLGGLRFYFVKQDHNPLTIITNSRQYLSLVKKKITKNQSK